MDRRSVVRIINHNGSHTAALPHWSPRTPARSGRTSSTDKIEDEPVPCRPTHALRCQKRFSNFAGILILLLTPVLEMGIAGI